MKTALFKVQIAFADAYDRTRFESAGVSILSYTQMGSVATLIVRGDRTATEDCLRRMNPLLLDILPLNLEEVFIYELGGVDYEVKNIVL